MNIRQTPTVYLVGKQLVVQSEIDKFLAENGATGWSTNTHVPGELLPELAGRVCYMSFNFPRPGGNKAYLDHIREVAHGSVFEHSVWNILIEGVSRSLTHELVRHRAGFGYSQLSQRYVDESVADYVIPDVIAADKELSQIWHSAIQASHEAYSRLSERLAFKLSEENPDEAYRQKFGNIADRTLRRKAARQAARSVLPNATETKIFVTANARAWRQFLEQRGSRHADPEIRKLANIIHRLLLADSPAIFGDYESHELPDGTCELRTSTPKI